MNTVNQAAPIDSVSSRMTARQRYAALLALGVMLEGCAAPAGPRPGVVLDSIQQELVAAAASGQARSASGEAVEQALLPPLQIDASVKAPSEARFDIAVQNAPAGQVFMAIVEGTPYSMLVPAEVSGSLTLNLKGVTVRDVLDTIRDMYGYDYRLDGSRIFITPNTLQTRMFEVNYLTGRRQGSTNVTLTSSAITTSGTSGQSNVPAVGSQSNQQTSGGNGQGTTVPSASITTSQNNDFWRDIQQALVAIVGNADGRNVVINASSGVILVRALPGELRNIEKYLRTTQLVVDRQVMLEAKIIDVSLSDDYQAGVNWAAFGRQGSRYAIGVQGPNTSLGASSSTPLVSGATGIVPGAGVGAVTTGLTQGFYGLAFQSANFAAMLNFLETQGSVHVLSSPRVSTLNNQKAVLKVGSDEFFVTNVSTTTTSGGTGATTTSPTVTLTPFFSGIALDVTPQIDEGDQIILHVHPAISNVTEKSKTIDLGVGGSLILPLAASTVNESDSIVRVRDGNIVAIGGLMRQRQSGDSSGLPGTSDQSFTLFGQRGRSFTKSELVILIKPTIIREDSDWRGNLLEAQTRLQEFAPAHPVRIIGQ